MSEVLMCEANVSEGAARMSSRALSMPFDQSMA